MKKVVAGIVALFVLTGCLTQGQAQQAQSVALSDARFATVLAHPHGPVTALKAPGEDRAWVEVRFDTERPFSEWPADSCDRGDIGGQPWRTIRWLVDYGEGKVLAVAQVTSTGASCLERVL